MKTTIKKLHKAQELDKKFKTNKFAKEYKEELVYKGRKPTKQEYAQALAEKQFPNPFRFYDDIIESANQVKSWKRGPISETVNLTYIFLAFIIGFSLCAVVMTPLVINSI